MTKIAGLAKLNFAEDQILSISFVDAKTISQINEQFVNHIGITDVISFDYRNEKDPQCIEDEEVAGELIVYPDIAKDQCKNRKNSSFACEITLYLIHGILHLTGMNDQTTKEKRKIREKERIIIKKLKQDFIFDEILK